MKYRLICFGSLFSLMMLKTNCRSGLTMGIDLLVRSVKRSMESEFTLAPLFLAAFLMLLHISPGSIYGWCGYLTELSGYPLLGTGFVYIFLYVGCCLL